MNDDYIINNEGPEITTKISRGSSQSTAASIYGHNGLPKSQLPVSQDSLPMDQTTNYIQFGNKLTSVTSQCPLRSFTTVNIAILWAVYIPMVIVSTTTQNSYQCLAYNVGAMYPPAVNGANYQYIRYITSMFLTTGLAQILICTIFLAICSYPLEKHYGRWKFMFFYLMSGIGGNIIQQFFSPKAITVALSQCVYGMIPLSIGYIFTNKEATFLRKVLMMGAQIVLQISHQVLKSSTTRFQFIDGSSQLGGIVTGVLLTAIFLNLQFRKYWIDLLSGRE